MTVNKLLRPTRNAVNQQSRLLFGECQISFHYMLDSDDMPGTDITHPHVLICEEGVESQEDRCIL